MKQRIFTLVILLVISILGAIEAELTEIAYIDNYLGANHEYLDSNNILNIYKYEHSNVQQFLVKRFHIDGTEEDQLLYDFSDISDPGGGFYSHPFLHRRTPEGKSFFIFSNPQHLVLIKHEGNQLQAKNLLFSSLDNYDTSNYSTFFQVLILSDESILIHGKDNDSEYCLWKWDFEADTSSLYYTIPGFFTDFDLIRPYVTVMGEYIVISMSRYPYQVNEELPIVVLDSSLNSNIYYEHMSAIGASYRFDDNTYFAAWGTHLGTADTGVIYIDDDSFEYETKTSFADFDYSELILDISFELANSIFGAWRIWIDTSPHGYHPSSHRFILYQLRADGSLGNYTGLPQIVDEPNNYDYAFNLQGRLLLANYDEGIYTFQLADFERGKFANWPEGDTWQPDLEGYYYNTAGTRTFSNDDYAVFCMGLEDDSGNWFNRYYFLNLVHRVSVDDLVQSPSSLKAYPNPFTDIVQISSSKLPQTDDLYIYNLKGQKVKTFKAKGSDYIWDGYDDSGNSLGAGIYFLKGGVKERAVKIIKLK